MFYAIVVIRKISDNKKRAPFSTRFCIYNVKDYFSIAKRLATSSQLTRLKNDSI